MILSNWYGPAGVLLVAWPMEADGWCVLEVHQETEEQPVMVLLYRVAAA